jgi:hypothetical protein
MDKSDNSRGRIILYSYFSLWNIESGEQYTELSNMSELQTTADYSDSWASRERWRTSVIVGVWGIMFGVFYSLLVSPINVILILLGILLLIAGVNARIGSKPKNMIFTAIALLAMGGYCLIVLAYNWYIFFTYYWGHYYSSYNVSIALGSGIFVGLFCLKWGGSLLKSYHLRLSAVRNIRNKTTGEQLFQSNKKVFASSGKLFSDETTANAETAKALEGNICVSCGNKFSWTYKECTDFEEILGAYPEFRGKRICKMCVEQYKRGMKFTKKK